MPQAVSNEVFEDWIEHPCTEALKDLLNEHASLIREAIGNNSCSGMSFEQIGQDYVVKTNTARVYEDVLDKLTYNDLFPKEEISNNASEASGSEDSD